MPLNTIFSTDKLEIPAIDVAKSDYHATQQQNELHFKIQQKYFLSHEPLQLDPELIPVTVTHPPILLKEGTYEIAPQMLPGILTALDPRLGMAYVKVSIDGISPPEFLSRLSKNRQNGKNITTISIETKIQNISLLQNIKTRQFKQQLQQFIDTPDTNSKMEELFDVNYIDKILLQNISGKVGNFDQLRIQQLKQECLQYSLTLLYQSNYQQIEKPCQINKKVFEDDCSVNQLLGHIHCNNDSNVLFYTSDITEKKLQNRTIVTRLKMQLKQGLQNMVIVHDNNLNNEGDFNMQSVLIKNQKKFLLNQQELSQQLIFNQQYQKSLNSFTSYFTSIFKTLIDYMLTNQDLSQILTQFIDDIDQLVQNILQLQLTIKTSFGTELVLEYQSLDTEIISKLLQQTRQLILNILGNEQFQLNQQYCDMINQNECENVVSARIVIQEDMNNQIRKNIIPNYCKFLFIFMLQLRPLYIMIQSLLTYNELIYEQLQIKQQNLKLQQKPQKKPFKIMYSLEKVTLSMSQMQNGIILDTLEQAQILQFVDFINNYDDLENTFNISETNQSSGEQSVADLQNKMNTFFANNQQSNNEIENNQLLKLLKIQISDTIKLSNNQIHYVADYDESQLIQNYTSLCIHLTQMLFVQCKYFINYQFTQFKFHNENEEKDIINDIKKMLDENPSLAQEEIQIKQQLTNRLLKNNSSQKFDKMQKTGRQGLINKQKMIQTTNFVQKCQQLHDLLLNTGQQIQIFNTQKILLLQNQQDQNIAQEESEHYLYLSIQDSNQQTHYVFRLVEKLINNDFIKMDKNINQRIQFFVQISNDRYLKKQQIKGFEIASLYSVGQSTISDNKEELTVSIGNKLNSKLFKSYLQNQFKKLLNYQHFLQSVFSFKKFNDQVTQYTQFNYQLMELSGILKNGYNQNDLNKGFVIEENELQQKFILYQDYKQYKQKQQVQNEVYQSLLKIFIIDFTSANQLVKQINQLKQLLMAFTAQSGTSINIQHEMIFFSHNFVNFYNEINSQIQHNTYLLQNQFFEYIHQILQKLNAEINHLRALISFGQNSPIYFDIIEIVQEFIKQHNKQLITQLLNIQQNNFDQFINLFQNLYIIQQNEQTVHQYLLNKQELLYTTNQSFPIFNMSQLVKECQQLKMVVKVNPNVCQSIIQAYDKYINKHATTISQNIQQLMQLDIVNIKELKTNPLKLAIRFKYLFSNFDQGQVLLQISKADEEDALKFIKALNKSCAFEIKTNISKANLLDKFTPVYNIQSQSRLSIFYQKLELYVKQDYTNVTELSAQKLDLISLLSENKFILQQLITLEQAVLMFKVEMKKQGKNVVQYTELPQYPSLIDMNRVITPLYEVCSELAVIQAAHKKYNNLKISEYPAIDILYCIERIVSCILLIRNRSQKDFPVFSNFKDLQTKKLIQDSQSQPIFVISYQQWLDYALFAEDYVQKLIPSIMLIYALQFSKYNESQLILINNVFSLPQDQIIQKQPTQFIFNQLEQNNEVFDQCINIWMYAQIDNEANKQLQKIFTILQNITIESRFTNHIFENSVVNFLDIINAAQQEVTKQNQQTEDQDNSRFIAYKEKYKGQNIICYSKIQNIVILPTYVDVLMTECLSQISLILNNVGYYGDMQLSMDNVFDSTLQYVQDLVKKQLNKNRIQYSYDKMIEQKARDLENVVQVTKMIYGCVKRIPNIFHDLLLVYKNGSPITISGQQVIKISILTNMQVLQIIDNLQTYSNLLNQYIVNNTQQPLLDLVLNHDFCKKITQINSQIQIIHKSFQKFDFSYIIRNFSAPFDRRLKSFNEELQLNPVYSIKSKYQNIQVSKLLVPCKNFEFYPLSLMMPLNIQVRFAQFEPFKQKQLTNWKILKNEIFQNLDDIQVNKETHNIISITSGSEELKFYQEQPSTSNMQFLFDQVVKVSNSQLRLQIKSVYDMLHLRINCYVKQKINQKTVYQNEVTDQTKDLPSYFNCFDLIFNKSVYTTQIIVINTYIQKIYNDLYIKAMKGIIVKEDFRFCYFLLNDISVYIITSQQLNNIHKKALLCQLQQWQEIFSQSISTFLSKSCKQIVQRQLLFSYQFYDQGTDDIWITDSQRSFKLQLGPHWIGQPNNYDANLKLKTEQQAVISQILSSMSNNQTIFLTGFAAKQYTSPEMILYSKALSRYTNRRSIFVFVTEDTFAKNLQRIEVAIISGYIVILIGLQYLPANQLLELVSLSNAISKKRGALKTITVAKDISQYIIKYKENYCIHNNLVGKTLFQVQSANIADFKDTGYLIAFMPTLQNIQTATQYAFTEKQQQDKLSSLRSKVKKNSYEEQNNVFEQYDYFYQIDQQTEKIIQLFENQSTINIEIDEPLSLFIQLSPEYGIAFFELFNFLKSMNGNIAKLNLIDIKLILSRARDIKDNVSVAIMTLDYLLRQSVTITIDSDQDTMCIVLANFVATSFGLDKQMTQIILSAAKTYFGYNRLVAALQQNLQKSGGQIQIHASHSKSTFQGYFQEYIKRYCNSQLFNYIQLFSSIYQVPVQCMYDILFVESLLKQNKPIMLINTNQSYLNIFLSILASRQNADLRRVTTSEQFQKECNHLHTKKMLAIYPTSNQLLLQILDKIYGFQLYHPIIQDESGQSIYINDQSTIPSIIMCFDIQNYYEFQKLPICQVFEIKYLIFPYLSGSDGLRSVFAQSINILQAQLQENSKYLVQNIQSEHAIQFKTSSLCISGLLRLYQQKMLHCKVKDTILQRITVKLEIVPKYIKALISTLFSQVIKVFNIGHSVEEVLIIKQMFCMNLQRFGVIKPQKRKVENQFIQLVFDDINDLINNDVKRQQNLYKSVNKQQEQLNYDQFSRNNTSSYLLFQQQQRKTTDSEELNKIIDFNQLQSELLSDERYRIGEIFWPFCEFSGFLKDEMQQIEQQVKKQSQVTQSQVQLQNLANDIKQVQYYLKKKNKGQGDNGSIIYNLDQQFILNAFIKPIDLEQSKQQLATPFVCSVFNAAALFFLIISNNNKQYLLQNKKNLCKVLQQKYQEYIQNINDMQSLQNHILQDLFVDENTNNNGINEQSSKNECSMKIIDQNKLPAQFSPSEPFSYILYSGKVNVDPTSRNFDKFEEETKFISYDQLEVGLLNNVTDNEDMMVILKVVKEAIEQAMKIRSNTLKKIEKRKKDYMSEQTNNQENQLYEKIDVKNVQQIEQQVDPDEKINITETNPYDSDEENEQITQNQQEQIEQQTSIEQNDPELMKLQNIKLNVNKLINKTDNQHCISLRRLNEDVLHFDAQRMAQAFTIASCMQSPVSFAVCGNKLSGKSILINVAKLLIRDNVENYKLLINEIESDATCRSILKSVCNMYLQRNYQMTNTSRYQYEHDQVISDLDQYNQPEKHLDYYQDLAFPCYHLHASDNSSTQVNDSIIQLLRDHIINLNNNGFNLTIDNQFQNHYGQLLLSDTSFMIECLNTDTALLNTCCIRIDVPNLSEQYLSQLVSKQAQMDNCKNKAKWSKQFIDGIQHIKQMLPKQIQESYVVIQKINQIQRQVIPQDKNPNQDKINDKIMFYETLGYDFEGRAKQNQTQLALGNNADEELDKFNIHSYLAALRNIDQIDQLQIENIIEQLASLCMLNKLQINNDTTGTQFTESPWSDSQIVLDKNYNIYHSQNSYVINLGLQNAKRTTQVENISINNYFSDLLSKYQQMIVPQLKQKLLTNFLSQNNNIQNQSFNEQITQLNMQFTELLDSYLSNYGSHLISINQYNCNSFYYYHFAELFRINGQKYDPFIASKVFEVYVQHQKVQQFNQQYYQQIIKQGNKCEMFENLTHISGNDDLLNIRKTIERQLVDKAAVFFKLFQQYDEILNQYKIIDIEQQIEQLEQRQSEIENTKLDDETVKQPIPNPQQAQTIRKNQSYAHKTNYQIIQEKKLKLQQQLDQLKQPKKESVSKEEVQQLISEDMQKKEFTQKFQEFQNFSLISQFTLKPLKIRINLSQLSSHSFEQFIELFAELNKVQILCHNVNFNKLNITKPKIKLEQDVNFTEYNDEYIKQQTTPFQHNNAQETINKQKIIINIPLILQKVQQKATDIQNDQYQIVKILIQWTEQLQQTKLLSDYEIQFLQVLVILRISVLLALGIKLDFALLTYNDIGTSQFNDILNINVKSLMQSFFPSKIIKRGRNLAQLPYCICSYKELEDRLQSNMQKQEASEINDNTKSSSSLISHSPSASQSSVNLSVIKNTIKQLRTLQIDQLIKRENTKQQLLSQQSICFNYEPLQSLNPLGQDNADENIIVTEQQIEIMTETKNQQDIMKSFQIEQQDVVVFCTSSILQLKSSIGMDLGIMISRILETNNVLPTIFDEEEMQILGILISQKMKTDTIFHNKLLSVLLSTNYSFITLTDDPSTDIQNIGYFQDNGNIKPPILQLLTNIQQKHRQLIQQEDQFNQSQQIQIKQLGVMQTGSQQQQFKNLYEMYINAKIIKSQKNLLNITFRDVSALYKLSNCNIFDDINYNIEQVSINNQFVKNQFILCLTSIYKQMQQLCQYPHCTFVQFSSIASKIVELLYKKLLNVFDLNYLIEATHKYYRNLSDITQKQINSFLNQSKSEKHNEAFNNITCQIIEEQVVNAISIQLNQLKQQQQQFPSDKMVQFHTASAEVSIIKNYFEFVLVSNEVNIQKAVMQIQTAHISAVLAATYICFGQNNNVDLKLAKEQILNGSYGNIDPHVQQLLKLEENNNEINIFNVLIIAILQNHGFYLFHPDTQSRQQNSEQQQADKVDFRQKVILGNNTIHYGASMYMSDVYYMLQIDCPIYLLLKILSVPWTPNDEYYTQVMNIVLQYKIGVYQFITNEQIAITAAACLVYLQLQKQQGKFDSYQIFEETKQSIQNNQINVTPFLQNLRQNVIMCDMESEYTNDFQTMFLEALTNDLQVLVIQNFGSSQAKQGNIQIIQKYFNLLFQQDKNQIQEIIINNTAFKANIDQQLIIFSCKEGIDLISLFKQYQIYQQYYVDKISVCFPYQQQKLSMNQQLQYNKLIFQQLLIDCVFGQENGQRGRSEQILFCNQQLLHYQVKFQHSVKEFIKDFIYSQMYSPEEMKQIKIEQNVVQRLMSMSSTQEQVNKQIQTISFVSTQNGKLKKYLDNIFTNVSQILTQQQQINQLLQDQEQTDDVGDQFKIKSTAISLVQTMGNKLFSEISYALVTMMTFVKGFDVYHLPVLGFTEQDTQIEMFTQIKNKIVQYEQQLKVQYSELIPKDVIQQRALVQEQINNKVQTDQTIYDIHYLFEQYPLLYHLKNDYLKFKKLLISIILSFLGEQGYKLFPFEYAANIITLCQLLFLVVIGLTTANTQMKDILKDFESLQRIMCPTQQDMTRLITSTNLQMVFSETSIFSLQKINNDEVQIVDDINQTIPKICVLSSNLQNIWLKQSLIARYNQNVNQTLPWLISNHASFVSMCKQKNFLISFIQYMNQNNNKASQNIEWIQQYIPNNNGKLLDLPPQLKNFSEKTIYESFQLSVASDPKKYLNNIETLYHQFSHIINSTPLQILEKNGDNIIANNVQKQILTLTNSQINKFCQNYIKYLYNIFGLDEDCQGKEIQLSRPLIQLYNIIHASYHTQKVYIIDKSKFVVPPFSVSIIYYDNNINVSQLLQFCHSTIDSTFKHEQQQLVEETSITEQLLQTQPILISAHPILNGAQVLKQLLNIHQKRYSQTQAKFPCYVLVPASLYSQSMFHYNNISLYKLDQENQNYFNEFKNLLQQVYEQIKPNTCYINNTMQLVDTYLHGFWLSVSIIHNMRLNNRMNVFHMFEQRFATIRGFTLLLLRYTLLNSRANCETSDQIIIKSIQQLFNQTVAFQSDILTSITTQAPIQATQVSDLNIAANYVIPNQDIIDQSLHQIAKINYQQLVYNDYSLMENFMPTAVVESVHKCFGIDLRIRDKMNVTVDDESQDSDEVSNETEASTSASQSKTQNDDKEEEDFDDSMSMFSNSSKMTSKTNSSIMSGASNLSGISQFSSISGKFLQQAKTKQVEEQNCYKNLIQQLLTNSQTLIDINALERSIGNRLFSRHRKLRVYNIQPPNNNITDQQQIQELSEYSKDSQQEIPKQQHLFIKDKYTIEDFQNFIKQLESYKNLHLDVHQTNYRLTYALQQQQFNSIARRIYNSSNLNQLLSQFQEQDQHNQNKSDLEDMNDLLKYFITELKYNNYIQFGAPSRHLTLNVLESGLSQQNIIQDSNLVLGSRGFSQFENHWVISASAYAPVLGDIFNYMRVMNAVQQAAPLHRQRIIVSAEIPYKHVKILPDGQLDFGKQSMQQDDKKENKPFYLVLRNFELQGLVYDQIGQSVCDVSHESREGFCQTFDLYATVVVIDPWQTGYHDAKLEAKAPEQHFLHVSTGYVPIPMRIGGHVRPVVLLPNKTKLTSEEFVKRGAFFGIKFV